MEKQIIITIGREFGSGGHALGKMIAEKYGLKIYDKELLYEVLGEKKVIHVEDVAQFDEVPRNIWLSKRVRGYSSSPEENIARMQFDYLEEKAKQGKSFLVIGRCAEELFRAHPHAVCFFVLGDPDKRREYLKEYFNVPEKDIDAFMEYHEKRRKAYHNYYCSFKWGDSRAYDMCINASRLGFDKTFEVMVDYIEARIAAM